jgi:hypothetical protein
MEFCLQFFSPMKVRLTRKYAEQIDGIDLSAHDVGDLISVSPDEARLIIAEGWAHADRRIGSAPSEHRRRVDDRVDDHVETRRSKYPDADVRATAADES